MDWKSTEDSVYETAPGSFLIRIGEKKYVSPRPIIEQKKNKGPHFQDST